MGFWDQCGWGYGLSIVKRSAPGDPRGLGWDGAMAPPATGIRRRA